MADAAPPVVNGGAAAAATAAAATVVVAPAAYPSAAAAAHAGGALAGGDREARREARDYSRKELVASTPAGIGAGGGDPLAISSSKQIAAIEFGTMSGLDMIRASSLQVCSRELYKMPQRAPAPHGCLDPRLGISNKADQCGTCGRKLSECAGHFGHITLELPVFHIGFLKAVIEILQNICKTCSRVLLGPSDRAKYRVSMRAASTDALRKTRFRKLITDLCKKATVCPFCGAHNGQVKKVAGAQGFKLVHDRYKRGNDAEVVAAKAEFQSSFDSAGLFSSEPGMKTYFNRAMEDLNPLRVRQLLVAIPDEDCDLLWVDRERGRPENLILTHLLVPPVAIRPSVPMDAGGGGSNEDDLTIKLQEIISMNASLRVALSRPTPPRMIMENWDFLQIQVASYINGDLPGLPPAMKPKRPIRGLCQRLKGKQGRFRGNLSGKRVDFSGRTVISPDPNLPLFCVGVPELVAKDLTYPERVTAFNITKLRALVISGPQQHPGANYVRTASGAVRNLAFADCERAARDLRIGDTVERHLADGDAVLFNRQPSLHKMSIMCHRAVIMPWRTFRFNECCCTPYNADFDGDEMNLHVPQTEEARAEAALLMDVRENLITPRSGEPLIAATQDFLTAAYLLTRKDTWLTRDEFCQFAATLSDATEEVCLPAPAVLKPVALWTGKQLINVLLRPNDRVDLSVSFEMAARNFTGKAGGARPYLCPNDGFVIFRNGRMMSGNLDKACIGGGSKKGLVYVLIRDNEPALAARALLRLTKMCTRWLSDRGFSIGIEDVAPSEAVSARKSSLVAEGYGVANERIGEYKAGRLALLPGCNEEQSLESMLNGILSRLRDSVGSMCMEELPSSNAARIMATCGSKGSVLNICQMVACVGQQSVGGSRIQEGFVDRTLPAFPERAKEPPAKGFVANSFYTGLTATEFFFHTMGGREGLVDTAVKTAETGYMQRRMMKALEDLSVAYDSTVRTSGSDVVQFRYGDDGLDPAFMETTEASGAGRPVDLARVLLNAQVATCNAEHVAAAAAATARAAARAGGGGAKAAAAAVAVPRAAPAVASGSGLMARLVQPQRGGAPEPALTPKGICAALDEILAAARAPRSEFNDILRTDRAAAAAPAEPAAAAAAADSGAAGGVPARARIGDDDAGSAKFQLELRSFVESLAQSTSARMRQVGFHAKAGAAAGGAAAAAADHDGDDAAWVKFDHTALTAPLPSSAASASAAARGAGGKGAPASALPLTADQESAAVLHHTARTTRSMLVRVVESALRKYRRSQIQPGEAVGAVAAHSLGEPATQMTLKTFHFAGVASMNVTLGVPRIKEIMNASRKISTPIIEATLENANSEVAARIVKARLEKTALGDVASHIREVYAARTAVLEVKLDLAAIARLQLTDVSAESVANSIRKAPKLRLKPELVRVTSEDTITVCPPKRQAASRVRAARQRAKDEERERERAAADHAASEIAAKMGGETAVVDVDDEEEDANKEDEEDEDEDEEERLDRRAAARARAPTGVADFVERQRTQNEDGSRDDTYYGLQALKAGLPGVIVQGIPTVNRAVITHAEGKAGNGGGSAYKLLVEGDDLLRVMGTPGVRGCSTASNNITEVASTLGIEASRVVIQSELARTYGSYGISIDCRHLQLLADVMTYRGEVLGITRFGIAKMKDSVLMLASFEKTPDHLFDAAIHSRKDPVRGVSESIIVGVPIPLGTGLFKLQQALPKLQSAPAAAAAAVAGSASPAAAGAAAAAAALPGTADAGGGGVPRRRADSTGGAGDDAAVFAALHAATEQLCFGEDRKRGKRRASGGGH